jgi:hypothetical protein
MTKFAGGTSTGAGPLGGNPNRPPRTDVTRLPRSTRPLVTVATMLLLASASLLALTPASAGAATTGAATSRALWVWDTSTPQATVDLAVAQGVDLLYAAVPPHVDTSPQLAQLQALSAGARAAGLRVDALGGDPGWVDNPTWVVDSWLRPAMATGLFTGVHVDIEPYGTSAWQTNRATVVKRWLATLDTLRAAAAPASLQADIPFWLDQVPTNGSTLDREVMRRTAGVTVMAYRNTADGPDGTIALSAKVIRAGQDLSVPVRIGQETTYLGSDPTEVKQTFFGQTRTQLEAQLALVSAAYGGSAAFAGLALHDASGYAAMAP